MEGAEIAYYQQKWMCDSGRKRDVNGNTVEMRLTFEEWYRLWDESGKWNDKWGRGGRYVMCRKDDVGHYELGNVYIGTVEENSSLAGKHGKGWKHTDEWKARNSTLHKGRKRSAETRERMREAQLGKRCSDDTKRKLSEMNKGKPMKRVNCRKCGMETSPQNLSRHEQKCLT